MNRLYNLDYLRGIAAFGIMIYHYTLWIPTDFSADTFMARLGLYGVSIFYVLSGLTLHYVYYDKMIISLQSLVSFFKKRAFRIFPLLWLVTFIAIGLSRKMPNIADLFLNLSELFGFVRWDKYFSPGVWSIGNELVFYTFFPVFIFLAKTNKWLMTIFSFVIFVCYLYFAFFVLDADLPLSQQWKNYIHPFNQVFLFLAGFLIGVFLRNIAVKNIVALGLLFLGLFIFVFYPVAGESIKLVTGTNRLIFTLCSVLICIGFYKLNLKLPDFIHRPLTLLGEASYSVYLLHPIVYSLPDAVLNTNKQYLFSLPESIKILFFVGVTLMISYFVYEYFEKYFMKLGKKNINSRL